MGRFSEFFGGDWGVFGEHSRRAVFDVGGASEICGFVNLQFRL